MTAVYTTKLAVRTTGDATLDTLQGRGSFSENFVKSGLGNTGGDLLGVGAKKLADKTNAGERVKALFKGGESSPKAKSLNVSDIGRRVNDLKGQGHALERHGGSITDSQLSLRARTGIAPDGSRTRRGYTPTSTAFDSDELLVHADDFLRNNHLDDAIKNADPGALRVKVSGDTGVALGRGYVPVGKKTGLSGPMQKVEGLTNAEAWYVLDPSTNIWKTNTIYPIPGK